MRIMMVVHEEAHYVESLKRDVKLHKHDVNIKSQSFCDPSQ